jgi:hypothetical protein
MSALAVVIIAMGALMIWSGFTGQNLFTGDGARIPRILKGET